MSDEFQTVSAKRGDRSKYRRHREILMSLAADAPSELIAADYRRVIADIDVALAKIEEAGGAVHPPSPPAAAAVPPPPPPPAHPARRGIEETPPGMRPLTPSTAIEDSGSFVREGTDARTRMILIAVAAVIALAGIAYLIWKAADRPDQPAVVTATATGATIADEGPVTTTTASPAVTGPQLTVTPDTMDYGIIRKGTRATRQYELANNTDEPLSPQVSRSTCRCLYYEHAPVIPPRGKETLTVTIDGAKAKAGPLLESVRVTSKTDPSVVSTFDVTATVR